MSGIVLDRSKDAFAKAANSIPGGVDSPVRAFGAVGGSPVFIDSGFGSKIVDIDGNTYTDYVCSWGPLILGHANKDVVAGISGAVKKGTSFGAPTTLETTLAESIKEKFKSIERVRMVSSGTEATMSAIRLARGFTGRDIVVKFNGCYHGHVDALLVKAGSGAMTFGTPTSPGVPQDYVKNTVVLPYNDVNAIRDCCKEYSGRIACIIMEPVAANMGVIPPRPGYLEAVRKITKEEDIVLVFDEIITGFRVALGGAQELYGVTPDLTTLGKIIGGGMPVGAYGGRADIMDMISPAGPVYQAGTLSGNPVAMTAGISTLACLAREGFYGDLEEKSALLAEGLKRSASDAGIPVFSTRVGSLLCTFFSDRDVTDFVTASQCDTELYGRYFHGMLERGVYFAPSQFEAAFVSSAHSRDDIEATIAASSDVMKSLADGGAGKVSVEIAAGGIDIGDDELKPFVNLLSDLCCKAERMLGISIEGFKKHSVGLIDDAERLGKEIHYEQVSFTADLIAKSKLASSPEVKKYIMGLITEGNHIELIEDNVLKLLGIIRIKVDESVLFSDKAVSELDCLFSNTTDVLKSTGDALKTENRALVRHILEEEAALRNKACEYEEVHEDRLISGVCAPKASKLYLDMVNSIREINWHIGQVLERIFANRR